MKCVRHKFVDLDYSQNVEKQKRDICKMCADYKPGEEWGKHCDAHLICLITGERLGPEAFAKIPKEKRAFATHSLSDTGRKTFNLRLDKLKKNSNRPLW